MKNVELKKLSDEMLENVVGGMEPIPTERAAYERVATLNFYGSCIGLAFTAYNGFKSVACYTKSEFTGNARQRYKLKEKSWNSGLKAIGALAATWAISSVIDSRAREKYHIDPPTDY